MKKILKRSWEENRLHQANEDGFETVSGIKPSSSSK
ncbi:hypothetical protein J2S19_003220 [Metabacillus malikii]|uniref:Uncharacterized protein n=1 Tax=Metabacillus malikii TaxID=1504265 RepID=A0ABT9ZL39_9BACI|nr:hypothetical protein [Metabacillus malikii]